MPVKDTVADCCLAMRARASGAVGKRAGYEFRWQCARFGNVENIFPHHDIAGCLLLALFLLHLIALFLAAIISYSQDDGVINLLLAISKFLAPKRRLPK